MESETPRISDLKTARELNSLPTNVRSIFYEFGLSSMSFVPNGAYWPEFAGSRFDQWATSWDGTPTMDGFGNSALSNITQTDAIKEVRLDMVNNSAEFGQMGQFTLVSKSGTNEIHGTAFEYYQSPAFRARNRSHWRGAPVFPTSRAFPWVGLWSFPRFTMVKIGPSGLSTGSERRVASRR
jgi:hypothetical protein